MPKEMTTKLVPHPQFKADPANSAYKNSFQDSWDQFFKNPRIQLRTVPNARLLVLDDQPQAADEAIASFVNRTHLASVPKL